MKIAWITHAPTASEPGEGATYNRAIYRLLSAVRSMRGHRGSLVRYAAAIFHFNRPLIEDNLQRVVEIEFVMNRFE